MWAVLGTVGLVVLGTASAVWCRIISARERANSKCMLGLMLALLGCLFIALGGIWAWRLSGTAAVVVGLANVAVALGLIAGTACLAILGLGEIAAAPSKYKQGLLQGILALVLGGLSMFALLVGGAAAVGFANQRREMASLQAPVQPSSNETLRFVDENFTFRAPGPPWTRTDAKKIVPDSCLGFARANPNIFFSISVAQPGVELAVPLDQIVDSVKAHVQAAVTSVQWLEQTPRTVGGMPGVLLYSRASIGSMRFTYARWISTHQGRVYDLTTWGPPADELLVRREADRLMDGFQQLDPGNVAQFASSEGAVSELKSERNAYTVHLGPGWRRWPGLNSQIPAAENGALHGQDTCLYITALRFDDGQVDFDTLLNSAAVVAQVNLKNSGVQRINNQKLQAAIVAYTSSSDREYRHHELFARLNNMLAVVHGWTSAPQKESLITDAISSVTFSENAGTGLTGMTPAESSKAATVLNELGLTCLERLHQPGKAATLLEQAVALDPNEAQLADNLALAHVQNDQPRLARVTINQALKRFPGNQRLRARAAAVEEALGDPASAITLYEALFSDGFQDDAILEHYIGLLSRQKSLDAALAAITKYRQKSNSRSLTMLHAVLLGQKEQHDQAIAMLQGLRGQIEFDPDVMYLLGQQFNQAGRYEDAMNCAREMLTRGYDTPDTYLVQAQALVGNKQYRPAKTALESALKKNPSDRDCLEMMRYVSSMLGEGDSSLVRTPIEPVAIPAELLADAAGPPPADADDFGAYFLSRVSAISFEPGKELRRTERRRVRIVNQKAVEELSTFEFGFDPVFESIYVNKVEVTDAAGKVVTRGKVEDSYVLDAPHSRSASQDKVLHIPVSGLAPGSTLELMVTRRDISPPKRMSFTRQVLSGAYPTRSAALVLKTPDMSQIAEVHSASVQARTIDGSACWQVVNPPRVSVEPLHDDLLSFLPNVTIGDAGAAWKAVGDEYLDKVKDLLEEDADCRQLAAGIVAGQNTPEARLAAILDHVQGNYVYKAIEFGRRAQIPQKPTQMIQNKFGDCKDHALLLYHLLRSAGFDPKLVLVDATDALEPKIPSLDQFDHMITCIGQSGGGYRFIDGTDKDGRLIDGPPADLAGKTVLVLSKGASELARIPDVPADSNVVESERRMTLESGGNLVIHETAKMSGAAATFWRAYLRATPADSRSNFMQQAIAATGVDVQIGELNFSHLDDPQQALQLEMTYTLRGRFNRVDRRFVGTIPACWERYWMIPETVERRISPFRVRMPLKLSGHSMLEMPAGMRLVSEAPRDNELSTKFGSLRAVFARGEREIRWTTVLRAEAGSYGAASYSEFERTRRGLVDPIEPALTFESGSN